MRRYRYTKGKVGAPRAELGHVWEAVVSALDRFIGTELAGRSFQIARMTKHPAHALVRSQWRARSYNITEGV